MSLTLAELDRETEARVAELKARTVDRLDVAAFAREHPWAALGIALGTGVLLAGTGADERAAGAVASGAKAAPSALAGVAKAAPGAVAGLAGRAFDAVRGDSSGGAPGAAADPAAGDAALGAPTVSAARTADGASGGFIASFVRRGLNEVLLEMERAAREMVGGAGRRYDYAPPPPAQPYTSSTGPSVPIA